MQTQKYLINLNDFTEDFHIGSGAYGSVTKVHNIHSNWPAAIKTYTQPTDPKQCLAMVQRLVSVYSSVHNPFLLDFLGYSDQPPFSIVFSYMPYGSLWNVIHNSSSKLNNTQKTNIAIGIAHGMRYLHYKGIVHGNLKSTNILLDDRVIPKIADFSLFSDQSTQLIGTPNWMAPEQVSSSDYGPPADVYAFGMILYELLTGQVPFNGMKSSEIFDALSRKERPPLPLPGNRTPLEILIDRCWNHDPARRPTFDYILNLFSARDIEFPKTDSSGVEAFLHFTQQYDLGKSDPITSASHSVNRIFSVRKNLSCQDNKTAAVLAECARDGAIEDLACILEATNVDVNIKYKGRTCLHWAAMMGHHLIVKFLLQIKGINPNIPDDEGQTPLMISVQNGKILAYQELAADSRVDKNITDKNGRSALHIAVLYQRRALLVIMFTSSDYNQDITDKDGKTARQYAVELGIIQ